MNISKTFARRISVSLVSIAILVYLLFHASFVFFIAVNAIIIGCALFEFYSMLEKKGLHPSKWLGISLGAVLPLFIYVPGEMMVFAAAILIVSFINFDSPAQHAGIVNTSVTLFGLVYVALLASFFTKLKFLAGGTLWVTYAIWVTKWCDVGAYFIGTSFGRMKPFTRISPNKSIEGIIGGVVFSLVASLAFKVFLPEVSIVHILILGLVLPILGQIGDLAESLIKRECEVKDSGVIPGLGGILDILDSLLFTVPFLYYYLKVFLSL